MKKFTSNKNIAYFVGIIAFLLIWWIISLIINEKTLIFPDPFSTFKKAIEILGSSYVYKCIVHSLLRLLIGFSISLILALVLGIIAGNNSFFKNSLVPFISFLKSIPTAALVFLFLIILGANNAPIIIVSMISFPVLYESVVAGIENIGEDIKDAIKLESTSTLKKIIKIQIPLMFPYLLVGIASSFALSFKIEIMAEIITGSTKNGLGCAILAAQKNDPTNMLPIFAYSLIAITLMFLITLSFKKISQRCAK